MSDPNPVHALNPEAGALIRVSRPWDVFTMDRVLERTHETGVDYWYLACAVAIQAAGMLTQACGSKVQAVDLVDCWLNSAVRECVPVRPVQVQAVRLPPLRYGDLVAQDQDLRGLPRVLASG